MQLSLAPLKALRSSLQIVVAIVLCSDPARAAELIVTGVIRAQEEVIVRSEFSGIVQRIAVREGERVREGQLLTELKNERQKITLELSRARLAKASASVDETRIILDNAEKELERVKIAADALPRKELEDRGDQVLRLKANLNAQLADFAQAREEVKLRENELKETQLLAPFRGTVTQIFINRGDTLKPMDTQVLELVAMEQLYAEVLLPSHYVQKIRLEQKIKVQIESESMGHIGQVDGKVNYINPKIDASSRTFKVKIGIPNANGRVRPGMLAQVRFDP
jgi:HlyD family secretion protein